MNKLINLLAFVQSFDSFKWWVSKD